LNIAAPENGCVEMARLRIVPLSLALVVLWCVYASAAQDAGPLRTTLSARAFQQGEVVRLDVTCSCQIAGAAATVFGHAVPLFPVPGSAAWRGSSAAGCCGGR